LCRATLGDPVSTEHGGHTILNCMMSKPRNLDCMNQDASGRRVASVSGAMSKKKTERAALGFHPKSVQNIQ